MLNSHGNGPRSIQSIRKAVAIVFSALCMAGGAAVASAALLTSDVDYSGIVLDLSPYENGEYNFTFGPEPLPGGITFTAAPGGGGNSGDGSVLGQGRYGIPGNGIIDLPAVYAGLNSASGYAQFEFATPQSVFGAYFNYSTSFVGGGSAVISVLDADDVVLESWELTTAAPISTPGGVNEFEFRGIDLGTDNFTKFRFGGNYIAATSSADGTSRPPQGVSAPSVFALVGLGFVLLGYSRRGSFPERARAFWRNVNAGRVPTRLVSPLNADLAT